MIMRAGLNFAGVVAKAVKLGVGGHGVPSLELGTKSCMWVPKSNWMMTMRGGGGGGGSQMRRRSHL